MKEDESSLGCRADSGCWLNVSQGHTEKEGSLVLYFSSFPFLKIQACSSVGRERKGVGVMITQALRQAVLKVT